MPYPYDEDEDNRFDRGHSNYGSSSSAAPAAKTEEDIRRAIDKNKNAISNIELKTDKDGNSKLFGLTVDKSMLPAVQMGLNFGKVAFLENSKKLYKVFLTAAMGMGLKGESAQKAAATADFAARWGVIGIEQIMSAADASGKFAENRRNLYQFFHPIMEATSINGGNNEVIGLAYKRARGEYSENLKWMMTDLPTLAPMIMVGLKEQNLAKDRYKEQLAEVTQKALSPVEVAEKEAAEVAKEAMKTLEADKKAREFTREHRKKWVDEQMKALKSAERTPEKRYDLERIFDRKVAPKLEEVFMPKKDQKSGESLNKEDQEKANKNLSYLAYAGTVVSQLWKGNWKKKQDEEVSPVHVPEMIDHLRKEIANQCDGSSNKKDDYGRCDIEGKSADDIQITVESGTKSLKAYILEMFQQHERDREPLVNWVKRDKKGHVVEVVDPLGPALVTKLEPAINLIANAIASGLDPAALVNLIGGNKIIVHGKNGAKTFANEERVEDEIEKLVPVMSSREVINLEEYLSKFEKPEEIKNTIKDNLEKMKGDERLLFASLFPDDILTQLGMKQKEITAMRREAHAGIYDFTAANIVHLAKKDDEYLKKLGLAEDEIKVIKTFSEKIEAGDEHALKTAVDGHDKSIIDAVRTAGLLEQYSGSDGKQYWSGRIGEMSAISAKMKEAPKEANSDEKEDDSYTRDGYDENTSSSHAEKVSKKGNGHSSDKHAKRSHRDSINSDPDLHSDDSMEFGDDHADSFEGTRGRHKPRRSDHSAGFSDRERSRSSSVDDERLL